MSERIWTAALVVIGDEILSGRTQDKNVAQIAAWLNVQGIRLAEVRVVRRRDGGDRRGGQRAARAQRLSVHHRRDRPDARRHHRRCDRRGAGRRRSCIHPEAVAVLERYYATRGGLTEARLRMARVPEGADLIENRMSGAPGIRIGNIFIMAGVPHITAGMLDALTGTLEGGRPVLSRTIGCWVAGKRGRRPAARDRAARMRASRSAAIRSSATGGPARTSSCAVRTRRWSTAASPT